MTKPDELTGKRFGLLTVIVRADFNSNIGGSMWVCECDCGGRKTAWQANLKRGRTRSCGCIRKAQLAERNRADKTTHGMALSVEYSIWGGMIDRATNPKSKDFRNYQERGITVCDRWRSFENFYADMGPRPSPAHSIDRRDNDGDYTPENCRWATPREQSTNRRGNIRVLWQGSTKVLSEWAAELGINYGTLYARYRRGLRGEPLFHLHGS